MVKYQVDLHSMPQHKGDLKLITSLQTALHKLKKAAYLSLTRLKNLPCKTVLHRNTKHWKKQHDKPLFSVGFVFHLELFSKWFTSCHDASNTTQTSEYLHSPTRVQWLADKHFQDNFHLPESELKNVKSHLLKLCASQEEQLNIF